MKKKCLWCERFYNASKVNQKYCKKSCTSAASRSRNQAAKNATRCNLSTDDLADVSAIRTVSSECADYILTICAIAGAENGKAALDAIWDFITKAGFVVRDGALVLLRIDHALPY